MSARWRLSMVCVAAISVVRSAAAQARNPAGDSAVARGDFKRLVDIYAPVVLRDSTDGLAWFRLGMGYHARARYMDAVRAYRSALVLRTQPAATEFRIARAFAQLRNADSAAIHLVNASQLGVSPSVVRAQKDFAAIRRTPQYVSALERVDDNRYPCRKLPEAHQLDFWIGDWTVTPWGPNAPTTTSGQNHVHAILESCTVLEEWTSAGGGFGKSFNFWDTNRRKWRQVWVDDSGTSLDYEGEFSERAMRFSGWTLGPNGQRLLQKLTFFDVAPDTVRQLFEQSTDNGKTWTPTYDLRYVRKR